VTVLLIILYVLVCIFLILVVLLQQGKGADLAGAFGGGGSQTSFGPRGTTNIMHRLTTGVFVLFVLLSITLAILSGKRHSSVMEDVTAVESVPVAEEGTTVEVLDVPDTAADEAPADAGGDAGGDAGVDDVKPEQ
jgi:preprotein translocase subunit SecG